MADENMVGSKVWHILETPFAGGEKMKLEKYRKKPVVVEAYRTDVALEIQTLEGIMRAEPGDYIITGVSGEQYPCKPDIFRLTYEKVDDPE